MGENLPFYANRTFSGEEKILMILSKGSCREGQDPEGSVLVTDAER